MQMLGNRVAVQFLTKSKNVTKNLIKMLDDSHNTGTVKFVGPDCNGLKVGQTICFGNQREPIKVNGKELVIMEDSNIFGILDGEEVKNN